MRGFAILYLAACGNAAAVGLPESSNAERPSLWDTQSPLHHGIDRAINHHEVDLASIARIVEDVRESISKQISSVADRADALADTAHEFLGSDRPEIQGHGQPNQTIYQYIKSSDHTTKFADLIDQHENLVKLLNSTDSQNYTLFVPLDEAFDGIPDDPNNKPSKEAVEALLKYHIGVGEYPASRILTTGTIPTVLEETWLGGDPQRLRTSVGLAGVRVNFYSKVLAANIGATNGVIHGVGSVLAPPPMIGRVLSLFPSEFSTLLLAYEKTNFVQFIHNVRMIGSTVFAPSNRAFSALGPKANAFLFNTEKGRGYLKALLKYHIVANATLYSDAFYDKTGNDADAEGWKREHYDLVTLLDNAHISVDKATLAGFTSIKVNGYANVVVRDGIGKNGVIQVVDKVPVPPCNKATESYEYGQTDAFGGLAVAELVECLNPYLEDASTPLGPGDFEL